MLAGLEWDPPSAGLMPVKKKYLTQAARQTPGAQPPTLFGYTPKRERRQAQEMQMLHNSNRSLLHRIRPNLAGCPCPPGPHPAIQPSSPRASQADYNEADLDSSKDKDGNGNNATNGEYLGVPKEAGPRPVLTAPPAMQANLAPEVQRELVWQARLNRLGNKHRACDQAVLDAVLAAGQGQSTEGEDVSRPP